LYRFYAFDDASRIECADGPERYRDVYRHIHDIFATEGVTNVEWAWVVNHESRIPDEEWNHVDNYYPGDEYVDIISVDGYNWGDDSPGGCPVDAGWKTKAKFHNLVSVMPV
jgi:beta-mannanase